MELRQFIFIRRKGLMKKNKKGFAISTMLYGLIFITIAIFYMIITIVSDRNQVNAEFVNEIREELNNL